MSETENLETREAKIERLLSERRELAGKFDAVSRRDEIDRQLDDLADQIEDQPFKSSI